MFIPYLLMALGLKLTITGVCWIHGSLPIRVLTFGLIVGLSVALGLVMQAVVYGGI